jgi:hypothetical protein
VIADPRPATEAPAGCSHPDSRIVWGRWIRDADNLDRYRIAEERCAVCGESLAGMPLWESEVVP